jgi:hypothetical protein
MSFYNSDITEQYLAKLFDDCQKETARLLTDMKTLSSESMSKEVDIQKQLTLLNSLMSTTVKLKNLKKKITLKQNGS